MKKGGNAAITKYQTIASGNCTVMKREEKNSELKKTDVDVNLLCLDPITLKASQLRATCFFLDSPIMGDKRYNGVQVS